jgi:hypothetical protein
VTRCAAAICVVVVCVVAAFAMPPSGVAAAAGAKTFTVTLSSDGAVVAAASDASGAPVVGLSLTMLARSDSGTIVGPRPLAAEAEHPGRYVTGPSALPEGSWVVTVSDDAGTRTTAVLTSSGPAAVAKLNPRHPQPTRTTAGNLVAENSSWTNRMPGVVAVVLGVGLVAAVILASRRRSRCRSARSHR